MKLVAYLLTRVAALLALSVVAVGCSGADGRETRAAAQETRAPDELLVERLAIAYSGLRDVQGARKREAAQRYARVAVDALAGPRGRHGAAYAPGAGVLPEDADRIVDEPGLALRAYDTAPATSPVRAAIDQHVLGSAAAWRTPRMRYDAIDRAVAAYTPERDTVRELEGEAEQALAWALLALKTEDLVEARARADRGAEHAKQARDAVRAARAGTRQ